MEPDKKPNNDVSGGASGFTLGTEVAGGAAGLGVGATSFWMALRKRFADTLEKTGIYGNARDVRDKALKNLSLDPNFDPAKAPSTLAPEQFPKTTKEEFFRAKEEIRQTYKGKLHAVHERLGVADVSLESLRGRLKIANSVSDRMEIAEKTGTFAFMAATLIIGCGVLLQVSRNLQLKHKLEEKELSQVEKS